MFGRISKDLSAYQQVHLSKTGRQGTGTVWLSKLINQLWLVMWRMWDHRNKINKGTRTAQDQSDVDKLHLEVRREFNLGKQGLLPTDYHLVEDRSQILSYDLPQLKAWHSRILNARAAHTRVSLRLHDQLKKSRQLMSNWLRQVA